MALKLEGQDQTQDEVKVSVQVTFGDHLVESKGLKKDSWLLIKLSSSLGSINQVISSECQEWFFRERSLLPMCRGLPPFVDKLSVVLGRLT